MGGGALYLPNYNPSAGVFYGPGNDGGGLAGVPQDTLSGKYVPLSQAEWDVVFAAAAVGSRTVSHSWGFQDASGNMAATVGTLLTTNGTLDYRQAVSGWTRTGTRFTSVVNERTAHASGTGVNPATGSVWWLGYIVPSTPGTANQRIIVGSDGATNLFLDINTTPRLRLVCAGVATTGTTNPTASGVIPIAMMYNKTASAVRAFTPLEVFSTTYNAGVVDGLKGFGGCNGTPPPMDVLLGMAMAGASAEFTDAQVRKLFQTLGFVVNW